MHKCEITATQWRMARAALKIGMRELAKVTGTSTNTLVKLESGSEVHWTVWEPIRDYLEENGIEFILQTRRRGAGVRVNKV